MNIKRILRNLINFIVPTPATVRKHRAPSARFATLEALAATNGDTLTRDGRGYVLVTDNSAAVIEFDNLAQVKAYLGEKTGLVKSDSYAIGTGEPAITLAPPPFVPVSLSPIGSHVAPTTDINRD